MRELNTVIIAGFETNALGISRALAAAGARCIGVTGPSAHPAHATKTAEIVRLAEWSESNLIAQLNEVAHTLSTPAALLITKDEAVVWISSNRAKLSPKLIVSLPSPEVVDTLMSKARFRRLAEQEDWPIPRTWEISAVEALDAAIPDMSFPVILKPQVKNSLLRSNCDQKAYVAHSAEELRGFYQRVARWEPEVIVQRWIEGGDDRVMFSLSYYRRDGSPAEFFAGRKIRQWPVRCGNTALCEPAPIEYRDKLNELAREIFSTVGYTGLGSVEFKVDARTNEIFIVEPTVGRTNYQSEIAVINGCNLPLIAWCDLTGRELPPASPPARPMKLVDGLADWKSARVYRSEGKLTVGDWLRGRGGPKRYMLFRPDDPAPFLRFVAGKIQSVMPSWRGNRAGTAALP